MLTDILRVFVSEYFRKVFIRREKKKKQLRLCLVTIFVFYFQKLVFGNLKKK